MPGGRPTVMTETTIRKLEDAFVKGLSDREACLYADIALSTLYEYCNKYPEFSERKEILKEHVKMKAKINIAEKISQKDINASYWYLERKAKDEGFSISYKIESKNTNHNINDDLLLSDEERQKRLNELLSKLQKGEES